MDIWIPENSANELILSRKYNEEYVSKNFYLYTDTLKDIVDYGTNLILRCLNNSEKSHKDIVVLPIFLKQIIEQLDAASVLLSCGCVVPTNLNLRSAFEASVYIDWILSSKSQRRAKAFYIWNLRRQLRWNKRALVGSLENKSLLKDMKGLPFSSSLNNPEAQKSIKDIISEIQNNLNLRVYRAWNIRFDSKKGNREYDPNWYEIFFKKRTSFYYLCKTVKRSAEYRLIYESGSEIMHCSRSDTHINVPDTGQLAVKPIRDLTQFGQLSQLLIGVGIRTYRKIIDFYRPEERSRLDKRYIEKWRKAHMTPVTVNYEIQYREL